MTTRMSDEDFRKRAEEENGCSISVGGRWSGEGHMKKRKYWKAKVGDWAEWAFHTEETPRLTRCWVFLRAEVLGGFLVTQLGNVGVWFAMRHQLRQLPWNRRRAK